MIGALYQSPDQPRIHRLGAGAVDPRVASPLLRSLAEGAYPQPDRLGHLLSQACFRWKLESPPARRSSLFKKSHIHRFAPLSSAFAKPNVKGRFTHISAKRYTLSRTRGAFHRQAHPRRSALVPCSFPLLRGRDVATSRRLFFHRTILRLDEVEDHDDSGRVNAACPKAGKTTMTPQRPYRLLRSERSAAR